MDINIFTDDIQIFRLYKIRGNVNSRNFDIKNRKFILNYRY